ncbi:G-type lectin S-receptor-like serine/threonine-protein kinase [Trichinella spiralis]|uniref:G-type lectin S-receptor-like serine/threonine-protein kinase n=1 Tax=Trichinella spiralis TaxID=6334 RepID=A0ABR3KID0_TRISP
MTPLGTPNYVTGKPSSTPPRESVGCSGTCTFLQLVMTPLGTPNYVTGKPSSTPARESVVCSVTCTASIPNAG